MKLWKDTKKHRRNLLGLVIITSVVAGILSLTAPTSDQHSNGHDTRNTDLSHCNTDDTCKQEQHYKEIVEKSGVKEAFKQLRADYETDASVRANCHPLVHVIGRVAGKKFNTVSAAYAEGDEFCWSGYYHGVMEALLSRMKPEAVPTQLNSICADLRKSKPYSFAHYNCVHGLGHGVMLISGHELFESLKNCDNLQDGWERESCYGGVYMENVMASNNPSHKTKYIIVDQPLYPCTAVEAHYKQQCYLMQTSQALVSLGQDFAKVFELCGTIEAEYQATCYQSLGRDASGQSVSDATATYTTCMLGHDKNAKTNCMIGAVKDFISYYHSDVQAKAFCQMYESYMAQVCQQTTTDFYRSF